MNPLDPKRSSVAHSIANALIDGFNRHYTIFREVCRGAKTCFEAGDWHGSQKVNRDRITSYTERVHETVERLHAEFNAQAVDDETWAQAKLFFIGMLVDHKQPELAETFFNSVFCKILHRNYFHNDFIFVRPTISTEYIQSVPPTYTSYYPKERGMRSTIKKIVEDFGWNRPFADLDRDVDYVMQAVEKQLNGWPEAEVNLQIQVLYSAFYRNKAAYIIGRAINGNQEYPFAIPVLHDANGKLYLDCIILDSWRISVLFSLSRAYFMVDMEVPSGYVQFLRNMMPNKPRSELYTMLGLVKQGKTSFYRDLMTHLRHSDDNFIIAPGIKGMVMLVFTLPSYPFVFKIIKDRFAPPKEIDRATVKYKYQLVRQHDRVGRMADTLEFSDVAFPADRIDPELLAELREHAASVIEEEGDTLIIKHVYIERRMIPLNLYLMASTPEQREEAVIDYGNAIKDLATANIFPGDMLYKNFGVTRYGRVIFYDYDEIEYMTDCNFREIPEAPHPEMEMASEPWFSVARNDVFPEEFGRFLLGNAEVRQVFLKHHRDLLSAKFWQGKKQRIIDGLLDDFYPYPTELRFCEQFKHDQESA
ncbi:bifunctional isocitrate dehydrogenase kinase/phosphatase [Leeia sp. TBRC 13508]|uniref:Isocitrate dehydrogenase kinase/phosphatase n=1 Tax=Leeia speluncae TaxID=2884804 RepID=A0ABS8D1B0_9NEIS|nr:bifunctional isocitrate dehydrogenase kinase/phosphatase [Leeia speluncae]MCB6181970.1 bifunctional isocitrate dehydrogenase kinase/phosphatase [Leeia speluncae]